MICQKCKRDFLEKDIDVSHDVPVYLFDGKDRRERKKKADKYGRHNLCKGCHSTYEGYVAGVMIKNLPIEIREQMIKTAQKFAESYFKKGVGDNEY
jgi:hypothetical protein